MSVIDFADVVQQIEDRSAFLHPSVGATREYGPSGHVLIHEYRTNVPDRDAWVSMDAISAFGGLPDLYCAVCGNKLIMMPRHVDAGVTEQEVCDAFERRHRDCQLEWKSFIDEWVYTEEAVYAKNNSCPTSPTGESPRD